jgi:hypothetical protein
MKLYHLIKFFIYKKHTAEATRQVPARDVRRKLKLKLKVRCGSGGSGTVAAKLSKPFKPPTNNPIIRYRYIFLYTGIRVIGTCVGNEEMKGPQIIWTASLQLGCLGLVGWLVEWLESWVLSAGCVDCKYHGEPGDNIN